MKKDLFVILFFLGVIVFGLESFSDVVSPPAAYAQVLSEEDKTRLRAEYEILQKEIAEWQRILDETSAKKNTIEGDVTALDAQIKKAEAEIKQRNVTISRLAGEINDKTNRIAVLETRLREGLESLAKLMREKNETERTSLVVLALTSQNLSEFFFSVNAIDTINRDLQARFQELRGVKTETQREKKELSDRKDQETNARFEVEVKKKEINEDKVEKQELLDIAKKEESAYQEVLAERQRRAEVIRTALFDLRDVEGIQFATALDYAGIASQKTGVRAALILAVLSQESDLGKNIGSCYVTNLMSGDGVGKNTGAPFQKVMKAPRDTEPFEQLTSALGLTWGATPVSCPLGKIYSASRGYGGAMGPSQFIPSTWQLFSLRLKNALSVSLPNPWDPKHAIMATALYLQDLGAVAGTYTAERNAACRYYSGRACDSRSPINYTYGNSVIAKAQEYQKNIDFLKSI